MMQPEAPANRESAKQPTSKAMLAEVKELDDRIKHLKSTLDTQRLLILSQKEEHQQILQHHTKDLMAMEKMASDTEERLAAANAAKAALEQVALDLKSKGQ